MKHICDCGLIYNNLDALMACAVAGHSAAPGIAFADAERDARQAGAVDIGDGRGGIDIGKLNAQMDRFALQNKEFDAVVELAKQMRRIELTPIVDDDYPEVRHCYESAVRSLIAAFKANGREWR